MPSVAFSVDSRGAEQGADRFSKSIDKIIRDAQRAVQAIEAVDKTIKAMGGSASNPALSNLFRSMQQVQTGARAAQTATNGLTVAMRDMGSASVLAFGPLSGVGSRFTAIGALAGRSNLVLGASVAVITGVGVAFAASVKGAADFEEAMIRVAKVTGDTPAQLKSMSAEVLRLSSTLGVPAVELAKIEQSAAQLGIRGGANLAAFAAQVGMLTRTTDLTAEAAANSLGRLISLTHDSVSNVAGMAASLTALGNNSKTTESAILSMTENLARSTAAFHVNSQTLLAVGGALADVGAKNQSSATALSQIFVKITQAAAGGKDLQKFADVVGITAQEFQKLGQSDPAQIFLKFLGALAQQGPRAVDTLQALHVGSSRNTAVMLSLGQVLGTVSRNLGMVADQYKNPTATTNEFERMNDALNRQLEIAGVNLENLGIKFGSSFVPALTQATKSLNDFLLELQGLEKVDSESWGTSLGRALLLAGEGWHALETAIIPVLGLLQEAAQINPLNITEFFSSLVGVLGNLGERFAEAHAELGDLWETLQRVSDGGPIFPKESVVDFTDELDNASNAAMQCSEEFQSLSQEALDVADAMDKAATATDGIVAKLTDQIEVLKVTKAQGEAAGKTEEIVREQARKGIELNDEQRSTIGKLVAEHVALQNEHKKTAKSASEAAKATESFTKKMENQTAAANAQTAIWRQVSDGTLSFAEAEVRAAAASDSLGKGMKTEDEIRKAMIANQAKANAETEKQIAVGHGALAEIDAQIAAYEEAAKAGLSKADADLKAADAVLALQAAEKIRAGEDEDRVKRWLDEQRAINAATDALDRWKATVSQTNETQSLKLELDLTRQVNQGLITELEKKIAIARQQAEINHQSAEQAEINVKLQDQIERQELAYIHLGSVIKDSLGQVFDALIAGTLDFEDAARSFGLAIGKKWVEGMLDSKLRDFDPKVEANFLSLGDLGKSIFGDLFSGTGAGGGSSGVGGLDLSGLGQKAIDWVGNLFSGSGGSSSLPTSYVLQPGFQDEAGGFQGPSAGPDVGSTGGGAFSGAGALAGAGGGYAGASLGNSLFLGPGSTSLEGHLKFIEDEILSQAHGINQIISTVVGAIVGAFSGGGGAGGGIIGTAIGLVSSVFGEILLKGIDRNALRNRSFSGNAPGIASALLPIPAFGDTLFGLLGIPTLGTALRRAGEGALDASPTFGGDDGKGGLQGLLGDYTRTSWKTGIETALSRGFSEVDVTKIRGATEGLFGQLFKDELPEDAARLAVEQGQSMAEFLSRGLAEGMKFDELFASLRAFADEAGITLMKAVENLPNLMQGVITKAQTFGQVDPMKAQAEGAEAFARELYGITALFQSDFPQGVNVAAIALSTLEKDGVKAFGAITQDTDTWLARLAEAPEEFQKQVSRLAGEGFTIDTTEFEARLRDISGSAEQIGSTIGAAFTAPDVETGIDLMIQSLGGKISEAFSGGVLSQLFDKTGIAAAFEPVFTVLNNLKNFNLTSAGGIHDAAAYIAAAVEKGRANLEEYVPILKVIIAEAKKADEIIKKALEPGPLEALADAWKEFTKRVAENLKGVLATAIHDGIDAGMKHVKKGTEKIVPDVAAGFAAFAESLRTQVYESVLNGIIEAFVQGQIMQALAPQIQQGMALGMEIWADGRVTPAEEARWAQWKAGFEGAADSLIAGAKPFFEWIFGQFEDFKTWGTTGVPSASDVSRNNPGAGERTDRSPLGGDRRAGIGGRGGSINGVSETDLIAFANKYHLNEADRWAVLDQVAQGKTLAQIEQQVGLLKDWGKNLTDSAVTTTQAVDDLGGAASAVAEGFNRLIAAMAAYGGQMLPHAATGGTFRNGAAIVGERGMEMVVAEPGGGFSVIPMMAGGGRVGFGTGPYPVTGPPIHDPGPRDQLDRPIPGPAPHYGGGPGGSAPPPQRNIKVTYDEESPIQISLDLTSAIEKAMDGGGAAAFADGLNEAASNALRDALVTAVDERVLGPLKEKFAHTLAGAVQQAFHDGKIDPAEIENIKRVFAEGKKSLVDAFASLPPELMALFASLKIGDAVSESLGGVDSLISQLALNPDDMEGLHQGIADTVNQAMLDGLTEAIMTSALDPLLSALSEQLTEKLTDAMADGLTPSDVEGLTAWAENARAQLGSQMESLRPFFKALGIEIGDGAGASVRKQFAAGFKSALANVLASPNASVAEFSQAVKQSLYEHARDALIDAFIDQAVIGGALAPMLSALASIFAAALTTPIEDTVKLIGEQMTLIADFLNSPEWAAAFAAFQEEMAKLPAIFGVTVEPIINDTREVVDAGKDLLDATCDGKCNLKKEVLDYGFAAANNYGRPGQTVVERFVPQVDGVDQTPVQLTPQTAIEIYNDAYRRANADHFIDYREYANLSNLWGRAWPAEPRPEKFYPRFSDGGIGEGSEDGWLAMLHGREMIVADPRAINISSRGGDGDDETKQLLRELIAEQRETRRELRRYADRVPRFSMDGRDVIVSDIDRRRNSEKARART